MPRFRPVRELYEDAMKEIMEVSSLAQLETHLNCNIAYEFYGYDIKHGWNDTWLVYDTKTGYPKGYLDGPIK